jgi:hypothetical protein
VVVAALLSGALLGATQLAPNHTIRFLLDYNQAPLGKTPDDIIPAVGKWKVVKAEGRRVLAQEARNPDKVFNVALIRRPHARDLDLSVKLKAIAGKDDQGGGLIWRAKDKNNYYIARYNPLEDNFRVYKVDRGKRTMFKNADIPHTPGWHTLRVTMRGTHIECFYDGKKYLECDDTTFPDTGMIGLWSKADAQSYFDDLSLTRFE